jgi:hypothetical protein
VRAGNLRFTGESPGKAELVDQRIERVKHRLLLRALDAAGVWMLPTAESA